NDVLVSTALTARLDRRRAGAGGAGGANDTVQRGQLALRAEQSLCAGSSQPLSRLARTPLF
ncbi:MAG: hypothetical protein U0075_10620, partial [Thermomicrobiales bacterium]